MKALLEEKRTELSDLCRRYRVCQLAAFGSAVREDFDPEHSDLDFLVEFEPPPFDNYADNYFDFIDALQQLFGLRVDLVVQSAITNPYFRESVQQTQELLYTASN